jgi:Ca-activated chloride channel family protein
MGRKAGYPFMHFAHPEAFCLLALVPLAVWWSQRPRQRGAARFSSLGMTGVPSGSWALYGPAFLLCLRALALILLIVALARPQTANAHVQTHSQGIAIQLVIDNSYSMRTHDYDLGDHSISRLDAVKHAVRLFIGGGEHGLSGRPDDRIGIITFARDPDVVCPATLDQAAALDALDHIQLAPPVGTNIGDALAWALDRLRSDPTKEKIIILLSDGSHNIKDAMQPLEAAKLAADLKIRVYTIGAVGNRFGQEPKLASMVRQLQARQGGGSEDSVDEPTMQKIAEMTGGKYYRATDTNGLTSIYEDIDRLEKTEMEKTVRVSYREWFLLALTPAVILLALEQLLAATRLLRVP